MNANIHSSLAMEAPPMGEPIAIQALSWKQGLFLTAGAVTAFHAWLAPISLCVTAAMILSLLGKAVLGKCSKP